MQIYPLGYGYNGADAASIHPGAEAAEGAGQLPPGQEDKQATAGQPHEPQHLDQQWFSTGNQTTTGSLNTSTSKPQDSASKLTRRLVAAIGQFEVRQVISEANKDLVSLRMAAAMSKGEDAALAKSIIRKLEKMIGRAGRKIKDLDREDLLKLQRARANQKNQQERAEEIKAELRKKERERKAREGGYLLEDTSGKILGTDGSAYDPGAMAGTVSEPAIAAQAQAIAAAEMSAASPGSAIGGFMDVSVGGASGAGAASGRTGSGGEIA